MAIDDGLLYASQFNGNWNNWSSGSLSAPAPSSEYGGSLSAPSLTEDKDSSPNSAYNFTGSNNLEWTYSILGDVLPKNADSCISFWINFNALTTYYILGASVSSSGSGSRPIFYYLSGTGIGFQNYDSNAIRQAEIYFSDSFITNTWYFLVFNLYTTSISISVNGNTPVLYNYNKNSGDVGTPSRLTQNYYIGSYNRDTYAGNFKMDDIRIYDRNITNEEISELYSLGVSYTTISSTKQNNSIIII